MMVINKVGLPTKLKRYPYNPPHENLHPHRFEDGDEEYFHIKEKGELL